MANDVLSDEQIAALDALRNIRENGLRVRAVPSSGFPLDYRHVQPLIEALEHRLAAVQAQPVSPEPKCPQCGWVNFEHEKGCSRSVSARPDVEEMQRAWFYAGFAAGLQAVDKFGEEHDTGPEAFARLKANESALASVSPLRDETREPDTAGREEWQPIETAPKDGTWVLVHHAGWSLPEVGHYSQYAPVWQTLNHGIDPTHWMPLPGNPPAALQRARESAQGKTR